MNALDSAFGWLWNASLHAVPLVALVLLAQRACGKRLTARWREALWWFVLVRLLLPVTPASPFSLSNLLRVGAVESQRASVTTPKVAEFSRPPWDDVSSIINPNRIAPVHDAKDATPSRLEIESKPVAQGRLADSPTLGSMAKSSWDWGRAAAMIWLSGVIALAMWTTWSACRFGRALRNSSMSSTGRVAELLADCAKEAGLSQAIRIVEATAVTSPALYGFLRPWLLLPPGLAECFSDAELRLIFQHELAHVKRRDIVVNWMMTAVQLLHWFNPIVWLAFARWREDREMACDEAVLLGVKPNVGQSYAETLIKLVDPFFAPASPGVIGIIRTVMHRRIEAIVGFRTIRTSPALLLSVAVVLVH